MEVLKFSKSGSDEILNIVRPINTGKNKDLFRKANALIRFHFKIDPDKLSDAEFSEIWQQLVFALDFESRRYTSGDTNKLHL